ncbi:MAG: DUF721 domain-containing protein [bacterium]
MKKNEPKKLGESISKLIKALGVEKKIKEQELLRNWSSLMGEKISKVTEVEKVVDGILFIKVVNSIWRNELFYMKRELLQIIEKKIGQNIINDIRFI